MFEKDNLTDFEKLLFAQKNIADLKAELKAANIKNGILTSDIEELKYRFKKEKPSANKLHMYKVNNELMQNKLTKNNRLLMEYKKMYFDLLAKTNIKPCKNT